MEPRSRLEGLFVCWRAFLFGLSLSRLPPRSLDQRRFRLLLHRLGHHCDVLLPNGSKHSSARLVGLSVKFPARKSENLLRRLSRLPGHAAKSHPFCQIDALKYADVPPAKRRTHHDETTNRLEHAFTGVHSRECSISIRTNYFHRRSRT